MATETDYQRLRLDLGLDIDDQVALSDAKAALIFEEVEEGYTDATSIKAASRVLAINRLMIQAASDVDYIQNNSTEKASQQYAMLEKELLKWQAKLDDAVAGVGSGAARFGRPKRLPARIKEHPGGWGYWGW